MSSSFRLIDGTLNFLDGTDYLNQLLYKVLIPKIRYPKINIENLNLIYIFFVLLQFFFCTFSIPIYGKFSVNFQDIWHGQFLGVHFSNLFND